MKCSACGKEAVNGMVVCDTGPCLFPGKVRRFLTSDAACGLGPNAKFDPVGFAASAAFVLLIAFCVWLFVFLAK